MAKVKQAKTKQRRGKRPTGTMHPQVRVTCGRWSTDVDEVMAPLIRALWGVGIITANSCQENRPGVAWVEFASTRDARMFLNLVADYPAEEDLQEVGGRTHVRGVPFWETLYGRVTQCGSEGDWEYDVHLRNLGLREALIGDEVVTTRLGPACFDFSVSIRFPATDIPRLTELVEGAGVMERAQAMRFSVG